MAHKTVNISAQQVLDDLELKLPEGYTSEAGELDTVCINTPSYELGWIVQLVMNDFAGYSFQVHEFQLNKVTGIDYEQDDTFLGYDEALDYIARRLEMFKENR